MKKPKTVDEFLAASNDWKSELVELRSILQATGLEETVKWGGPVYTHAGKNVVGIGGFKSYFGLWFFQGALLADPKKVLINAQEGTTRALRQLRYASKEAIDRELIESYVREAVELIDQGIEIKPRRAARSARVPKELREALQEHPAAATAFRALTAGRRREYVEYIDSAKRDDTKRQRISKILPMIAAGAGLNDKYRGG